MTRTPHTPTFTAARDAVLALDDADRPLARLDGAMQDPQLDRTVGLMRVVRATASLDDDDRERLARWFSTWMNALGQTRRAAGMRINPGAHWSDTPTRDDQ